MDLASDAVVAIYKSSGWEERLDFRLDEGVVSTAEYDNLWSVFGFLEEVFEISCDWSQITRAVVLLDEIGETRTGE